MEFRKAKKKKKPMAEIVKKRRLEPLDRQNSSNGNIIKMYPETA